MPPCAATVCDRVGNTLVTQAVRKPCSAMPKRRAQTSAASPHHDHIIVVHFIRISSHISPLKCDADKSIQPRRRNHGGKRDHKHDQHLARGAVRIIFDHHRGPHREMPHPDHQHQSRQNRGERAAQRSPAPPHNPGPTRARRCRPRSAPETPAPPQTGSSTSDAPCRCARHPCPSPVCAR